VCLILLRHTRPLAGDGICYGRSDLDLADDLAAEAGRIEAGLPRVDRIVTSPLVRCRRLAEAVAARRGLTPTEDARLAEMDFGRWEGRPWAEIPRDEVDAWAADLLGARPHGGESVGMLRDRAEAALISLHAAPGTSLVVTHAGVIRAALALNAAHEPWSRRIAFGGWIALGGDASASAGGCGDRFRISPSRGR
jgi:alpha-ribazole phosphatase